MRPDPRWGNPATRSAAEASTVPPVGAGGEAVVAMEGVGLRYGNGPEILQDVSFTLPGRSFHFLTGPSGAGKSSLLSLMYLARTPSRGRLSMFGRDLALVPRQTYPALRRSIGVVFQDFRLLDHLSALDNVALPLRVAGVGEGEIRRHVPELLAWVGLADHLDARPSVLSGGQKQRVAIARAVINRPQLLLADEPTGNVDDRIAVRLLHLFAELNKLGTTVVIATHNESVVRTFRFPRLHLEQGRLTRLPPLADAGPAGGVPPGGAGPVPQMAPQGGANTSPDTAPRSGANVSPDAAPRSGANASPDAAPRGGANASPDAAPRSGAAWRRALRRDPT
ncbi:cell division ATP-binding protein FtsE [Roseospirillum parvum]|uniref:Cell division ATP-binding protein FtsE n=1 Tax=Roseospirillum parvum TaxID=83401 RepID=A0A1G8CSS7_9PROT|nr:cell division ATP-binding protein FtsE [Roseospirillum parvum]